MASVIRYNKGTNIEPLLRKIYSKYIYKGRVNEQEAEELSYLYDNMQILIDNATTVDELDEIQANVDDMLRTGRLFEPEHNYLTNLRNERRNQL